MSKHRFQGSCAALHLVPGVVALLAAVCAASVCEPAFTAGAPHGIGPNRGTSAVADLDGDGNLDLTTGVSVLLGNGAGGFGRGMSLRGVDPSVFDVAARDFDDDGRQDLFLVSSSRPADQAAMVLYGRPRQSPTETLFENPVFLRALRGTWHLACADFNHDTRPDVAVVSRQDRNVCVFLNQGNRSFARVLVGPMSTTGHTLALGDFNGDSHVDIAAGSGSAATLFFGKGDGSFGVGINSFLRLQSRSISAHRFRAADLDRDGSDDLVSVGDQYVLVYRGSEIHVLQGLAPEPSFALRLGGAGRFVELADMNSDGTLDVVSLAVANVGVLQVFYGSTDAPLSFTPGGAVFVTQAGGGLVLAVGDMNGDTATDIVITSENSNVGLVFLNDASCVPYSATPGDSNADGVVNVADVVASLAYLFGGADLACIPAAEVNGDSRLNIADVLYLLLYLFREGPPLPETGVICE